jgi:hypothetical protein
LEMQNDGFDRQKRWHEENGNSAHNRSVRQPWLKHCS